MNDIGIDGLAGQYGETWFNDTEADHVHRCMITEPHDGYHTCGHVYEPAATSQYGLDHLCGIGWEVHP